VSFIILLVLGFVLSVLITSVYLSYGLAFLAGLCSGKVIYHKKKDNLVPHILLITGFILGYIIGHKAGSTALIIGLFVAGNFASYYAHKHLGLN
jgi:hypothetical protein